MAPAKKSPVRKAGNKVVAPVAAAVATGEPTGKWAQVLAETRETGLAIDDFEITEDLVLHPPTPARSKALTSSSWAYQAGLVTIANAVKTGASQDEIEKIGKAVEEAEIAYNEALYGGPEKVAAVEAYFANRPTWEKEAFFDAIRAQFLRLPPDGKCPTCHQVVDGELAGNADGSSTTSSTTGTSSKATSPPSLVSTPATGAEDPDPGPNSSPTT